MRARRGSALILVLLMTLAVAGLAVAAIFMSSSAGLLSRFYDRERDFRLAAESAIELGRSRLARDTALAIPDTGMVQLLSGVQIVDAAGVALPRVRVNLYAATTGDTSGGLLPHVTLVAASYDANGTRHVRRADLRRESFSRFSLFVDSFPSTVAHDGPAVTGRVHTNGTWRSAGTPLPVFTDSVSAVAGFSGSATFRAETIPAAREIPYPQDSTFAWMHTLADAGDLDVTPRAGGSRVEFVALDADGDGTVEPTEGFVRVFDLADASRADTTRLRVSPPVSTDCILFAVWCSGTVYEYLSWDDQIVQNQCGAFYRRSGRWHFFPLATHRASWAQAVILGPGGGNYPQINNGDLGDLEDYDYGALSELVTEAPTFRCFPTGSPYLMATERFTNAAGAVTGTNADTVPFGVVTPSGGWPAGGPYGGNDTTFTVTSRTCRISDTGSGRCVAGTWRTVGSWRAFGGSALGTIPGTVRQFTELSYLWPVDPALNPTSRRVLSATSGPVYVSGVVRGGATLRVAGRVSVIDRLGHATDPNDPSATCADRLGVVATADILVVSGLTTRVRRLGWRDTNMFGVNYLRQSLSAAFGGESRVSLEGSLMSLGGTVGAERPAETMGDSDEQLPCPDDGDNASLSNGGCLALTGAAIMRSYVPPHTATARSGYRWNVAADNCQLTDQRPPFFPLTNRYALVRTLEIEPHLARTPGLIRALLMRLKGRTL